MSVWAGVSAEGLAGIGPVFKLMGLSTEFISSRMFGLMASVSSFFFFFFCQISPLVPCHIGLLDTAGVCYTAIHSLYKLLLVRNIFIKRIED